MKSFGLILTVMFMLTFLDAKVYPQRDCSLSDIQPCHSALEDPRMPPTAECCDTLRKNIDCFCDYQGHYFHFFDTVRACHIEFDDGCPS